MSSLRNAMIGIRGIIYCYCWSWFLLLYDFTGNILVWMNFWSVKWQNVHIWTLLIGPCRKKNLNFSECKIDRRRVLSLMRLKLTKHVGKLENKNEAFCNDVQNFRLVPLGWETSRYQSNTGTVWKLCTETQLQDRNKLICNKMMICSETKMRISISLSIWTFR